MLDGWVVTTDAPFTPRDVTETILGAGRDYLMEVNENRSTLATDVTILFADPDLPVIEATQTRLHGNRIERRLVRTSTELVGYTA